MWPALVWVEEGAAGHAIDEVLEHQRHHEGNQGHEERLRQVVHNQQGQLVQGLLAHGAGRPGASGTNGKPSSEFKASAGALQAATEIGDDSGQ